MPSCSELQGHAIKNKDLLTASGAITLKGPESYEELEEDIQAVSLDTFLYAIVADRTIPLLVTCALDTGPETTSYQRVHYPPPGCRNHPDRGVYYGAGGPVQGHV